jgi:hypothetical protein
MDTMSEEEPFTLRALLVNLSSEDHIDSKDCRYSIAALTPFGNFEGNIVSWITWFLLMELLGADLVLCQLGLRMSFPTGSVVPIRGHELGHSTAEWTKESRFVGVHTTHGAVREHAYRNLGRPYPPLDLAPNFETEDSKRRKVAAARSVDEDGKSHGTNHRSADAIEGEAAGMLSVRNHHNTTLPTPR